MAQLGLEENDEDYNYLSENFFEYELTRLHIEQVNGKISHTKEQKTLCKLNGLRLTDELDNTIKNERNEADIQEIRERLDEIWQLQRRILLKNDCTCKMKVDTHKSAGVYFFRGIVLKR